MSVFTAPSILTTTWASEVIGPTSAKPKAKWARFKHMDFGLSGVTRALNLPTLEKRELVQEAETSLRDAEGWQTVKHGKVDSGSAINDDISAGVGGLKAVNDPSH